MVAEVIYRFGNFELDCRTGELRRAGVRLRLQGKPLQLLTLLLEHAPHLVSREQMRARLWPADMFVDFDRNLNAAVKKLREALSDSVASPRFIETMPRRGYRFIAPVQFSGSTGQNLPEPSSRIHDPALAPAPPPLPSAATPATQLLPRLLSIVTVAAALLMTSFYPAATNPKKDDCPLRFTLAVLPFQEEGAPHKPRVSDGLTDSLTARLVGWNPGRLGVISRRSVQKYRCSSKTVAEIGRELGVTYLVAGSVRREASRLRVTAEFVDAADQTLIWSRTLDLPADDMVAAQEELNRALLSAVAACLRPPSGRPEVAALVTPAGPAR